MITRNVDNFHEFDWKIQSVGLNINKRKTELKQWKCQNSFSRIKFCMTNLTHFQKIEIFATDNCLHKYFPKQWNPQKRLLHQICSEPTAHSM